MTTSKPARSALGAAQYLTHLQALAGLVVGLILLVLALSGPQKTGLIFTSGLLFALFGLASLRVRMHLREISTAVGDGETGAGRRVKESRGH